MLVVGKLLLLEPDTPTIKACGSCVSSIKIVSITSSIGQRSGPPRLAGRAAGSVILVGLGALSG
eukprot:1520540-Pyramimonas_sp.AAC.2